MKYALDFLEKADASIILISSIAKQINLKDSSIYSSTKAAVSKLAKNLAYDLSDDMIRVNAISPGFIETPFFAPRLANSSDYLSEIARGIPLKRIGKPIDIANAATFLASNEASYITGDDLVFDGGLSESFSLLNGSEE